MLPYAAASLREYCSINDCCTFLQNIYIYMLIAIKKQFFVVLSNISSTATLILFGFGLFPISNADYILMGLSPVMRQHKSHSAIASFFFLVFKFHSCSPLCQWVTDYSFLWLHHQSIMSVIKTCNAWKISGHLHGCAQKCDCIPFDHIFHLTPNAKTSFAGRNRIVCGLFTYFVWRAKRTTTLEWINVRVKNGRQTKSGRWSQLNHFHVLSERNQNNS